MSLSSNILHARSREVQFVGNFSRQPALKNCRIRSKKITGHVSPACVVRKTAAPQQKTNFWMPLLVVGTYGTTKLEHLRVALKSLKIEFWMEWLNVKGQSYSHLHRKLYDINVMLDQLAHPWFFVLFSDRIAWKYLKNTPCINAKLRRGGYHWRNLLPTSGISPFSHHSHPEPPFYQPTFR